MNGRNLAAEIRAFLEEHGPATAYEIGLGIRARRAAVASVLQREGFYPANPPAGSNPYAFYWAASPPVPQRESTTDAAPSQSARILSVLRDGRALTTAEIHARVGTCRLNSRLSELRSRGYVIETIRIQGVPAGPHAQGYRLLAEPGDSFGEAA